LCNPEAEVPNQSYGTGIPFKKNNVHSVQQQQQQEIPLKIPIFDFFSVLSFVVEIVVKKLENRTTYFPCPVKVHKVPMLILVDMFMRP
jgi:hypothetical protein